MEAQRVRRWLAERKVSQWWKAGLAVVLAVAALFGGLDRVETAATPFNPGQEFDDGQFSVTVERARLVDKLESGRRVVSPAQPGRRYLAVVATLRNNSTVPGRLRNELDLRDVPGAEFHGVWRYRDSSPIQNLGPGLTEQLVFTWLVPDDALSSGDVITVRVWKKTYSQLMVTYGGKEWLDSLTDYGVTELSVGGPS
ncbi:hypothetical protein [Mycobacterium sp. NAZ190054]|uniref:hypothetical protein n=1 Tax=Mycobacterium sp. NAZ190054 TaxID=1747766 RepID=UPI00079B79BA|nr:hypothetical protein [Mycobacterium sp. NAZ190054]KWX68201.1 hypothetical protein ASJ79_18595 [Mycobacterium sp. NAZ190054]